jgi:hypothetical protein
MRATRALVLLLAAAAKVDDLQLKNGEVCSGHVAER